MKYLFITCLLFAGCKAPIDNTIDTSTRLAEQTLKDSEANNKRLDSILKAVSYMGTRDSFTFTAQKLEVLYYRTGEEKYRIRHNRLVDSINKYNDFVKQQLNVNNGR